MAVSVVSSRQDRSRPKLACLLRTDTEYIPPEAAGPGYVQSEVAGAFEPRRVYLSNRPLLGTI